MSTNCAMIEAGPATIREFACGEKALVDHEVMTAALDGIDDPVALVDDRPVCVDALWRTVLQSMVCQDCPRLILVHPSWWTAARVERVNAAAHAVADQVVMQARSSLLARATPAGAPQPAVIVEITDHIVVVTGTAVAAEPRCGEPQAVAEAVIRAVAEMTPDPDAAVLIDVPGRVGGAAALAAMITDRLGAKADRTVVTIDDIRLRRLAKAVSDDAECEVPSVNTSRRRRWPLLISLVIAAAFLAILANPFTRHGAPAPEAMPTTFLVEGRVAVEVPAHWPTQRVVTGPGSARVQVTSPSEPQVALHVTQSPVADQTLVGTAEALKHAIDGEPSGVFVDFNPSGSSAGRPAVTYREVRAEHDIRWAIVLDRAVRIGIGCQSRRGDDDAVRDACELAVRSARAVG